MIEDYFRLALANINNRRTRNLLTVIGIFIGILAIVTLLSLGQSLQNSITTQFERLGANKITITPASAYSVGVSGQLNPLTTTDEQTVRNTPGVMDAAGYLDEFAQATFSHQTKNVVVIGYPLDSNRRLFEDLGGYSMRDGRKLEQGDGPKVVLGSYIADSLYERKVLVGQHVTLNGTSFQVVGIFEPTGSREDDSAVYMPIATMRTQFGVNDQDSGILAETLPGQDPATVAAAITKRMADQRGEKTGDETFTVSTSQQLEDSFNQIFEIVQAIIIGLASISLVVGGIGIMNTMYTSVLERTKEIGIMKAVGARNSDILALFLVESGMLGLVGGGLGVGAGFLVSKAIEGVARAALGANLFTAYFPPELAAGALLFSFGIGALSGALPAYNASKLKPIEALRYE